MELIFATQNQNKVKEIQRMLPDFITIKSLREIGCDDDIPETQPNLEGNALQKARYVYEKFGVNCFADDTGLEIEALNNEPGVYSARYAGEDKNSDKNMALVLKRLENHQNRNARFRTIFALILDGKEHIFEGKIVGNITKNKGGSDGFGYDPIFQPTGSNRTFAEMSLSEKNEISHRSRATNKLCEFLKNK